MELIEYKGHSVIPEPHNDGFIAKVYPSYTDASNEARRLQLNNDTVFLATTIGGKHYIIAKYYTKAKLHKRESPPSRIWEDT